jgi:hypothetical protein
MARETNPGIQRVFRLRRSARPATNSDAQPSSSSTFASVICSIEMSSFGRLLLNATKHNKHFEPVDAAHRGVIIDAPTISKDV